ncbi:hypothetical protein [Acinetobacter nosocomialis]
MSTAIVSFDYAGHSNEVSFPDRIDGSIYARSTATSTCMVEHV